MVASRWNTADVVNESSHLWHEKNSRIYTKVLGHVVCIVTSKRLGIGYAEQVWKGLRNIKSYTTLYITAERLEKQSIIYTTACMDKKE